MKVDMPLNKEIKPDPMSYISITDTCSTRMALALNSPLNKEAKLNQINFLYVFSKTSIKQASKKRIYCIYPIMFID